MDQEPHGVVGYFGGCQYVGMARTNVSIRTDRRFIPLGTPDRSRGCRVLSSCTCEGLIANLKPMHRVAVVELSAQCDTDQVIIRCHLEYS
jgi:hypothetical protein